MAKFNSKQNCDAYLYMCTKDIVLNLGLWEIYYCNTYTDAQATCVNLLASVFRLMQFYISEKIMGEKESNQ